MQVIRIAIRIIVTNSAMLILADFIIKGFKG